MEHGTVILGDRHSLPISNATTEEEFGLVLKDLFGEKCSFIYPNGTFHLLSNFYEFLETGWKVVCIAAKKLLTTTSL